MGLINDVLDIKRDIKYSKRNNYLLRIANETSLELAVEKTVKVVTDHARDLQAVLDLFATSNFDDPNAVDFVTSIENTWNGQIKLKDVMERYGNVGFVNCS
jgi:hypothetical protein